MSVAADPTVTTIITDALKHAGIFNPSTAQITEMTSGGFQTVKSELWAASTRDRLIETSAMVLLPIGSGQIDTPADFDHEISLDVYSCADNMAFTATAGASGTITAASTFTADISSFRGTYLFLTGGTGSGQYRQITDYNDTTKVLTITPAWTVNPDNTTTAFVGHLRRRLVPDNPGGWASSVRYPTTGYPVRYRMVGVSALNTDMPAIEISPVPNTANYAMILVYGPNLTRLDEAGTLFVKHMRERRVMWIDGLIHQACRRYDEARYPSEYQAWAITLQKYAAHNPTYDRLEAER